MQWRTKYYYFKTSSKLDVQLSTLFILCPFWRSMGKLTQPFNGLLPVSTCNLQCCTQQTGQKRVMICHNRRIGGKTCAGHLQWTTLLVSEKQWGLPSHITPHLSLAERKTQEHRKDTFKRRSTEGLGRSQTWGLMHKFSTQNFQVWAGLGCSSRFPPNGWRIVLSSGYAALHIRVLKIWPVVDLSAGRCAGTRWMRLPGSTAEKSVIKAGQCQGAVWEMQWWEMQWYIPHIN